MQILAAGIEKTGEFFLYAEKAEHKPLVLLARPAWRPTHPLRTLK